MVQERFCDAWKQVPVAVLFQRLPGSVNQTASGRPRRAWILIELALRVVRECLEVDGVEGAVFRFGAVSEGTGRDTGRGLGEVALFGGVTVAGLGVLEWPRVDGAGRTVPTKLCPEIRETETWRSEFTSSRRRT
jgi:hypothetical protein